MATIRSISKQGSLLSVLYSNGTTNLMIPAATGWVPLNATTINVPTGSGESSTIGSTGPVNPTPSGSVSAPVNDYPWPNAPENGMSPLRYSYRDCTDFVAWRINRDHGYTSAPWHYTWSNLRWQGPTGDGDAIGWRADWISYGRAVDITPVPGCIGWYGETGTLGHVFYIQAVTSTTLVVEQYNYHPHYQAYNTMTIPRYAVDSQHSYLAMPS